MIIAWWSAGVTSAVATKLAIDKYGKDNILPIYFRIDSAHPDNKRFMEQCEDWYNMEITVKQSHRYTDQFDVIKRERYVNGPSGAKCTLELKKKVRYAVERETDYSGQVFGFEYSKKEINRAIRFSEQYPIALPLFPLIENKMTKPECLYYLENTAKIKRPVMYELGYGNNNCIGCVKGGMGYWNKIRLDFPKQFEQMSKLEREVGRSCIKGKFLDELDPNAGRELKIITPDCGNFCDIEFEDLIDARVDSVYSDPMLLSSLEDDKIFIKGEN